MKPSSASRYQAITEYLFALQRVGIKLGFDNINALLDAIDHPERKFPSIHIAGTNGKGSTAAILASILMAAGYRVGLYTSPHLVDFSERIRINQQAIDRETVIRFTEKHRTLIDELQPSFFEVTTALAFQYFADHQVDIAIIETGMGGRLDSTNVLTPLLSMITPIGMDHQNYLGETLQEIAGEKAGIIKPGITCLTNNRNEEVLSVLSATAKARKTPLINVLNEDNHYQIRELKLNGSSFDMQIGHNFYENLFLNLPGEHQLENVLLAVSAVYQLRGKFPVSDADIASGLGSVIWKGRIHQISKSPNIIADVSHNPAGVLKTCEFLRRFFPKTAINAFVFLQADKDALEIAKILNKQVANIHIVELQAGKPYPLETLRETMRLSGAGASVLPSVAAAKQLIYRENSSEKLWLFIGSHYLAGEVYTYFREDAIPKPGSDSVRISEEILSKASG